MKILVCGGREFDDYPFLCDALDRLHARRAVGLVIHGGARGADKLAGQWSRFVGVEERVCEATWGGYHGNRAGLIRNQRMLDEERPDLVVAFPGGSGTRDMIARAQRARVPVWVPRVARLLAL